MRSLIDDTLRAHFAQTSQDTQSKLDAIASSLVRQLVLTTENTQRELTQLHTAKMQRLRSELEKSREESCLAVQQAQTANAKNVGAAQSEFGVLRAQLEIETAHQTTGETKTTTLDVILQKIQNSETKSGQLQQELQKQRKEMQDMGGQDQCGVD